jgi:outer membrane protein OmpA-like peptidoglycan-associated protein
MFINSKDMKNKITQEFNSKLQAFQSQKASIEQNLSVELEKEQALLDEKAKLEDRVKSLEQNITAQIDEKGQLKNRVNELKATVSKMLTTAKEQTKKITEEFTSKLQASQSQKASIEQNLSVEIEKEQALLGEKAKLEDRVKSLEQNITAQIDEKSQLENRVNELKATISKMLTTAKEQTQKVTQEFNSKLQALQSQKLSIEQNLTNEIEKSQYLIDENNKLKEKIIEEKNNLEGQLRVKESEIEKLKIEKEKTIQKAKAKQVLLKTFLLTNVQFKRASSELTDESKARLNDTAQKMKKYPNFKYEIQGHTDKSGKEEYNIKLSTQRAEATKAYLISQGVSPDILVTKGFGSSKPIADNKTKEGRIKNRRVIFVIKE